MNKTIWTFWENESNDKNIDFLIKKCFKSWGIYCPNWNIIILNYGNLNNWVKDIPIELKNYNLTFKSDYFRLYLLYNYGGVWLDSSIFLTCNIDFFIKNEKKIIFFIEDFNKDYIYSNWFIISLYPKNIFFKECLQEFNLFLKNPHKYENNIKFNNNPIYYKYKSWCNYIKNSVSKKDLKLYNNYYFVCYLFFLKVIDKKPKDIFYFYKSLEYGRVHKKLANNFDDMVRYLSLIKYNLENKIIKFGSIERYKLCEIILEKEYINGSIVDLILNL
jgi:mannosyltransferase OCH1-like enzyme